MVVTQAVAAQVPSIAGWRNFVAADKLLQPGARAKPFSPFGSLPNTLAVDEVRMTPCLEREASPVDPGLS